MGQVLDVRTSANVVEVFAKNRRVASHKRSYARRMAVTESAHMPSSHRRHAQWTPSRIVAWASKTGPSTAAFIAALMASRPHPEQGFRSALGVLRLEKRYGPERLELACARSLAIHSLSYKSVSSILQHGLEQRPLVDVPLRVVSTHANIRGPNYYQ